MKKFYVYAIRVDGKIKYIGKGKDGRMRRHMKMVHRILRRRAAGEAVRTTHFYNKLAKAWRAGSSVDEIILHGGLSEKSALKLEVKEIAKRRRRLWNVLPGGEHMDWNDSRFRRVVTRKMREAWKNPDRMAKHLKQMKRLHADPRHKAKISKVRRELNLNPDFRAATIKRNKSKKMREAVRKMSNKRWADPEAHRIMSEKIKAVRAKKHWGPSSTSVH